MRAKAAPIEMGTAMMTAMNEDSSVPAMSEPAP